MSAGLRARIRSMAGMGQERTCLDPASAGVTDWDAHLWTWPVGITPS